MTREKCPCCGSEVKEDILNLLAFRRGQMLGNGFPWQRKDAALLELAIGEILRLRKSAKETAA